MRAIIFLLCVIVVLAQSSSPASANDKKNILFINSYHHGYPWSDEILEGFRENLSKSKYPADLQIEYMDTKKYPYEPVNASLFRLYQEKFDGEQFDVIVAADNHAYNFVIEHREELFRGVPLVFCGMNDFESADTSSGNLTGVVENFDLIGTLNVVRRLHPDKTRMIVVGDDSLTGRSIVQQVHKIMAQYDTPLEVEFWFKLSLEETREKVEELPPEAFLYFIPWHQAVKGNFYSAGEVMEEIYDHSSVPIYTNWEFLLGHGAVGGNLLSGKNHGRIAAEMALSILEGEKAENIAVVTEPSGSYKFDYNVMQKLNIDSRLLPGDSIIINSPKAFYELSKELFWTIMVSFIILFVVLIFLVITMVERRKVQRKVLEQLSFQETLMDTIPQLVSWKDTMGRYLGANQTFLECFGIAPHGLLMKNTWDVIGDREYVQWSVEADNAVINQQQEIRKVKRKIIDHSGNVGWLEVSKVPLRDQAGRVIGILTSAENVSKEQELEKQLIQSQKMEAIGTLAGGIAHDFNNILTSIINSTELALIDIEDNTPAAKDLQRVLKAARRGSSVVKQILSFSRPSIEGIRPTDLAQVCQEVLSLMDVSLPSNIKAHARLDVQRVKVDADPTQMHQVILNLCTNAYHALQNSGGNIHVQIEEAQVDEDLASSLHLAEGKYVKITVADDGPGIEAAIISKIFDPFFTTKDITQGTGLGLSVVHGIVKGHRGAIRVESKVGQGTRFFIYLPQSSTADEVIGETPASASAEGLSILFIEDDEDQLNSVPRILQALGHEVVAVQDPQKALDLVVGEKRTFDLVISDYDMPTMRGTRLAETLSHLPFIIVSGRNEALTASMPYDNIRKVLVKPYDKAELEWALNLAALREEI